MSFYLVFDKQVALFFDFAIGYKWKWSSQLWSNLSSYKESPEKIWGSNGIWTYDLRDTGAIANEASLEAQFIPVTYMKRII